jgi:hypothetical protein
VCESSSPLSLQFTELDELAHLNQTVASLRAANTQLSTRADESAHAAHTAREEAHRTEKAAGIKVDANNGKYTSMISGKCHRKVNDIDLSCYWVLCAHTHTILQSMCNLFFFTVLKQQINDAEVCTQLASHRADEARRDAAAAAKTTAVAASAKLQDVEQARQVRSANRLPLRFLRSITLFVCLSFAHICSSFLSLARRARIKRSICNIHFTTMLSRRIDMKTKQTFIQQDLVAQCERLRGRVIEEQTGRQRDVSRVQSEVGSIILAIQFNYDLHLLPNPQSTFAMHSCRVCNPR